MVRLDPNYRVLGRELAEHRRITGPDLIRWCKQCERHLAGPTGLCPICEDEKPSDLKG